MLRAVGSLLRAGQGSFASVALSPSVTLEATPAGRLLGSFLGVHSRSLNTSASASQAAPTTKPADALVEEPPRKYRPLADKELWHEAWMYEDRLGTEDDPIIVPSTEAERIIGVTDPDDDNLVVWGILKAADPPRQFVEGGEFYVLKEVPYVKKVGDVIDEIEDGKTASLP